MAEGGRLERLRSAVEDVRTRSGGGPRTDPVRWLLIAGSILFPMGILIVILGWYGASHTPYLFEQVPYLISGGLLGVGMCIVGGFLYFGYWLTRLVAEGRERTDRTNELLASLHEALTAQEPQSVRTARTPTTAIAGGSSNGKLVATPKGTLLHRPGCTVVAGKERLRKVAAGTKGYELCKLCNPE